MRELRTFALALALCPFLTTSYVVAQSLAEIAEKEKERRARSKGDEAKTYTNEDLAESDVDEDEKVEDAFALDGSRSSSSEGERSNDRGEASWRARAASARGAVTDAEKRIKDLENEAQMIGAKILGSTDTMEILSMKARQTEIEKEIKSAREDLNLARENLEKVEDEAKKANVPPGWLRE